MEFIRLDVIFGIESWLFDKIYSKEIFLDFLGFNIICRDRKGDLYGGVIIVVWYDFGFILSFCSDKIELILGNIKIGFRKLILFNCCYRLLNK